MNKLDKKPNFIFHSKNKVGVRRHTIVGIIEDNELHIGYSIASDKDTYVKKLGTVIATGRAIKCPHKTIKLLERKPQEIKVLFNDITRNFSITDKILVIPNYHLSVKLKKVN